MSTRPYLVQRMSRRNSPRGGGVDAFFSMDYMGSSEFEWGALPQALSTMRSQPYVGPIKIEHEGCECWYVGTEEGLANATEFFVDQLGPKKWHLKEWTSIDDAYGKSERPPFRFVVAWWAIDARPVPWAIFMREPDAGSWIEGLKHKKEGK